MPWSLILPGTARSFQWLLSIPGSTRREYTTGHSLPGMAVPYGTGIPPIYQSQKRFIPRLMNRKIPGSWPAAHRPEVERVEGAARKKEQERRLWTIFALICLVALLWSAFLYARQEWVWVSVFLFIMVIGCNILFLLFRSLRY